MAEPLRATFYTLQHRDRSVLLPATIAYGAIVVVIVAVFTALNWGALQSFFNLMRVMPSEPQLSEEQGMSMLTGMLGMFGWLFLLLFPFYFATAAYEAACLRWMIRGEAPGFFGLTLDHDMWRVYGVYWVWFVAQIVVGFATSMLTMPLSFMMMGEIIAQGGPEPDPDALLDMQWRIQALSMLQYIPMAFIGIRFGPAAATSIARRQFSFFEAWNVTRDRFWALLGAYALLWLIFGLGYAALLGALYAPLFGALFTDVMATWPNIPPDLSQRYFEILFAPSTWVVVTVGYACSIVLLLIYMLLSYGVNARTVLAAIDEGKIERAA